MRILQINASYKPTCQYGGPTVSVSRLSELLVKNACSVEVYTTTANGAAELQVTKNTPQKIAGVSVTYFKRQTKDHSHFSSGLLTTLWKNIRSFDVVHIHAWWNLVSVLSCLIAHLRGVPVILSPRGTLSPYTFSHKNRMAKQLFHCLAGRFLLNRCYLHCTSAREQKAMVQLLKPLKMFNIHNLVSFPAYLPRPAAKKIPFRLLFLSRIEQKKGIELLFEALADLKFPYQLSIAGNGDKSYLKKLKALSRHYQIADHISWTGFKGDEKFELMAQHDLLVLPSHDENFGHVVIESLAVGTAVLISNKVGLAGYVKKNNLGWVCETTAIAIKNSLFAIFHSRGMLEVIREFAPVRIVNTFNDDTLIKSYLQMYQQVIQPVPKAHD
jgi:glycosyltransferase involved in cell wall biosynthesis